MNIKRKILKLIFIITIVNFAKSDFKTGNFIYDTLLEKENLVDTEIEIRNLLIGYFSYNPVSNEKNFKQIISEILSTSLKDCETTIDPGTSQEDTDSILKKEIERIIFLKKDLFKNDDFNFDEHDQFRRSYRKILFNNFIFQFKKIVAEDKINKDLIDNINFSDELIIGVLEKRAKDIELDDLNFEKIKKQFIEYKDKQLKKAKPFWHQLAEFRKEGLNGISEFLGVWISKLLTKEAVMDDETNNKFSAFLHVFPLVLDTLETSRLSYVNNFARNYLLNNKKHFEEGIYPLYINLWSTIFSMYAKDSTYNSLLEGIKLWVTFFFPEKSQCENCKRANFLQKTFLLDSFPIDLTKEQNAKERTVIYIMDALRIISLNKDDTNLKVESLARNVREIFSKLHYFLNFNPRNVWVIDKLDVLFNKDELKKKIIALEIIPFYKNLYSVIIAMSQDYKEVGKIDFEDKIDVDKRKNPIVFDFNDYLDYTRLFMNQLDDFPMEIEHYYTVFKIYNLFMNFNSFYKEKKEMEILAVNSDVISEEGSSFIMRDSHFKEFVFSWRLQNRVPAVMKMGDFSNKIFTYKDLNHYHEQTLMNKLI